MPFNATWRPYTKENIESIKAGQNGVYVVANQYYIYVGKGDIRTRMLAHFNGDNACITNKKPTQWAAEVTSKDEEREKELILELNPSCNKKVG